STASGSVSGRVTSPRTTCASRGSLRALSGVRTKARTEWPCRNASSTTRRPMLPVAPTTSTVIPGLVMISPCCSASRHPPLPHRRKQSFHVRHLATSHAVSSGGQEIGLLRFERSYIDGEAVLHIGLE